jgi:hypothetical protein
VTRVQGTRLRLQHGLLWAEMQYSSGSSYNRQTGGTALVTASPALRERN